MCIEAFCVTPSAAEVSRRATPHSDEVVHGYAVTTGANEPHFNVDSLLVSCGGPKLPLRMQSHTSHRDHVRFYDGRSMETHLEMTGRL